MKTIEQLEKEFDEFLILEDNYASLNVIDEGKLKTYIFQKLLPQVLSEVINIDVDWIEKDSGLGRVIKEKLKQKAKEMGINLPE